LALTLTIIAAARVNMRTASLYRSINQLAKKFETTSRLPEDAPIDTGDATIAIIGMGHLGTSVYDTLVEENGEILVGVDIDPEKVARHKAAGRNIIQADITDDEIWENPKAGQLQIAVLALHEHAENLSLISKIRRRNDQAKVFAVAIHSEEVDALMEAGAQAAWDLYSEAGIGFAEEIIKYCRSAKAYDTHSKR